MGVDTQTRPAPSPVPRSPGKPTATSEFKTRGEAPPVVPALLPEERFLTAKSPGRVKLREAFALTVSITTNALAAGLGEVRVPIIMEAGTLDVDILAPAFETTEGSTRKLTVPATGPSGPVRFPLYAVETGINVIEINAWNGPVHVAALKVSIAVEQLPQPERLTLGTASSDMDTRSPEEGEYTLEVVFEAEKNSYRFQLRSEQETLEPEYSPKLIAEQQIIITAIVNKLNGEARNINWFNGLQARTFLRNLGAELYNQLIPVNLQAALRNARQRIKRLNILSKSDALPWEIMFISDPVNGGGAFLAESASVSRWQYGARAPKVLRRSPAYVIIPPGAPEHAMDELKWVAGLSGNAELVDDLDELLALIEAGGFSLLHFAAHNVSPQNVMDGFYIPFGNSRFDMTMFSSTLGASYATNNTLVFMNACTSAGAAPMATEMAGWADRFLKRGAAAFVGSLWEVRDKSAAKFAEAFYTALTAGKTIGEAMKAGRETIGNDDPTRLAYTLFGNPLATMPRGN